MIRQELVAACCLLLACARLEAQDTTTTIRIPATPQQPADVRQLPQEIAEEAIRLYNAATTIRLSGFVQVPAGKSVDGDVVVLSGPVFLAGRVAGSLTVINGDLSLEPGSSVTGEVLVVGGSVHGSHAGVAGTVRSYPSVLLYRKNGEELTYAPERAFITRWQHRIAETNTDFVLALDGWYNRVEGAPIVLGPGVRFNLGPASRFVGDGRLILRTGENFALDNGRFGYRAKGEVQFGPATANVGVGLRLFDQVASVEPWPLRDYEAGWAAFLLRDDYRDWYRRRGWALYGALRPNRTTTLTLEARDQDVISTPANAPWTLFHNTSVWRANPQVSDGQYRSLALSLRYDSRNDRTQPSAGFLIGAELEASQGRNITGPIDPFLGSCGYASIQATPSCVPPSYQDGQLSYQRLWLDARYYTHVTPAGRLSVRLAGGGKLGGDDLPLQSKVSLGMPDPLPAYTFRYLNCGGDAFPGQPALCDRAIIAQAELRTHLGFDFGPEWANVWGDEGDERYEPFHVSGPDIVAFMDAGYAWNIGNGPNPFPAGRIPSLGLWQPDIGIGLDLGPIGAYVAKAIGPFSGPATFTVRMGRRF